MINELTGKAAQYMGEQLPVAAEFGLRIILCILVYFIGKKAIGWVTAAVRRMMERTRAQAGAVSFTVSMVKITLYLALILWIAMQFGLKESSVAAIVASGGVAIGLALQGGLSNFAGGFLILLFQPFRVGDYIITQEHEGTVQKIEILYTTLQTMDNRRVIVPNGNLANNIIVNVTAADKRKLEIKVGISYEDSISDAKKALERLIMEEPRILHEEEHVVFVAELAESSVIVGMRCWVLTDQYFSVLWRMNERIKEEFEKNGIHIPYPQLDVRVKKEEN